jgi:hypothetical protein
MKKPCLISICLALGLSAPLAAQSVLFSDPLNFDNGSWIVNHPNEGGGSLTYMEGRLNYLVATPSTISTDTGYRFLSAYQALPNNSWSVQVDVHLDDMAAILGSHQYANLNLIVGKAADPWNYRANIALDRYNDGTALVQDLDASITTAGVETYLPEILNGTTDATLLIAYDMTTGMLTYAYDADGVANAGVGFVVAHAADISGWSMSPTDPFVFLLVGGSGGAVSGPAITANDAYFSNFVVTSGAAVPEPATTALLAGCAVLGLACWWRRRAG